MTFFSFYCYYETLFHVVLLRRHREMHHIVMNLEHVSESCLAPRASFTLWEDELPQREEHGFGIADK